MDVKGEMAAHIFQALRYLGKDGVTPDLVARLRRLIQPRDRLDIQRSMKLAPGWMQPALQRICQEGAD
jgi:hypothetical protein